MSDQGTLPRPPSADPRPSPKTSLVGGVGALAGTVLVTLATFLPYVTGPGFEGGGLSVADCEFDGCGWFMFEPIGLALVSMLAGIAALTGLVAHRVDGPILVVAGVWALTLFGGYAGSATGSGSAPDASVGMGGVLGITAGVVLFVAGVVLWSSRADRSSARDGVATVPPNPSV